MWSRLLPNLRLSLARKSSHKWSLLCAGSVWRLSYLLFQYLAFFRALGCHSFHTGCLLFLLLEASEGDVRIGFTSPIVLLSIDISSRAYASSSRVGSEA